MQFHLFVCLKASHPKATTDRPPNSASYCYGYVNEWPLPRGKEKTHDQEVRYYGGGGHYAQLLNYTRRIQPRPRPWSKAIAKIILLNSINVVVGHDEFAVYGLVTVTWRSLRHGQCRSIYAFTMLYSLGHYVMSDWLYSASVSISITKWPTRWSLDH